MNRLLIYSSLMMVLLSGCISLLGPKPQHVTGTWVLESIEGEANADDRSLIGNLTLELREDGTLKTDLPHTMEYFEGTWRMDRKTLTMTNDGSDAVTTIVKVNGQELWLRPQLEGEDAGKEYLLQFVRE